MKGKLFQTVEQKEPLDRKCHVWMRKSKSKGIQWYKCVLCGGVSNLSS
jgi:hypothetical protein